jgi:hypothetical protein
MLALVQNIALMRFRFGYVRSRSGGNEMEVLIKRRFLGSFGFAALLLLLSTSAQAGTHHVRWEQQFGMTGQIQPILRQLAQTPGIPALTASDFIEVENRTLANYRFVTLLQLSQGIPVRGAMIRTWESLSDGHLVLMEANIDDGASQSLRATNLKKNGLFAAQLPMRVSMIDSLAIAKREILAAGLDKKITRIKSHDQWNGGDLERVIEASGRRGVFTIVYSHLTKKVKSKSYKEFPQADIPAMVYPIYEEAEKNHSLQQRVPVTLKNLNAYRRDVQGDPYASIKTRKFYETKQDELQGQTPEGQAQGFWSLNGIKQLITAIITNLPVVPNDFSNGGVYLEGKYATVQLHPDVSKFTGITHPLQTSERVMFDWKPAVLNGRPDYEMKLVSPFKSAPLLDPQSALNRVARRLPDHDPVSYINDGFDEIQVYYAIDTLMVSLQSMGFTDPELSTRPFHAYLFNPDIEYKNNAYYTDDTINFTTYSPEAQNYARDNSTIWHELGHGVMDRLMGDRIRLADTGGLSEGMADFVAQLIIQDVTNGTAFEGSEDFRIVNKIGFNLTNESHDDGEAYGGSMRDLLMAAYAKEGRSGLLKVADITLDAMRLARNHPALTANDWFESILFADHLGRKGLRAPDEMKALINQALASRNFRFDRGAPAELTVKLDGNVITADSVGSRYNPLVQRLTPGATAAHDMEVSITSSESYRFKYPVTIEVAFNGGALQGALKWEGEAAGSKKIVLNSEADKANLKVTALSGCDEINREDGSCQDYAYVQVINNGDTEPVAKKRFYLRIYNDPAAPQSPSIRPAKKAK